MSLVYLWSWKRIVMSSILMSSYIWVTKNSANLSQTLPKRECRAVYPV